MSSALPNNYALIEAFGVNGDFRIVGGQPAKSGEFRGQVRHLFF